MKSSWVVVAVAGLLSLAACERRDAATPTSTPEATFQHRLSGDISGDYRPTGEASIQPVASLFIGQDEAFAAWEGGSRASPPLILSLTVPQGEARVLLSAYVVTDDRIQMRGSVPGLGPVELSGRIDQGALATARRNLGDQTPVVTGTISVNGLRTPFTLSWWGGD
ncbi:MAG: hypothetical protein ACJAVC_001565 [Brevundimonas sp.]|jgi:hypothetical protein|uniref:hypothetical protein n=1 Tax=Brevundimonas sp. GW460-12-10-14-LB2 TaxID=1827469 RepID=UPI0007BCA2CD|nr:hypothetical protein [Brevundimonas sp. GW460-12-10-14-LB2]ANC53472.1 hypothetical protein A4249_07245 [Brevundimonas sp. GW460-12-10-14-LB2]MEA3474571.1 hypothetical protein [Pseudomonadota bacterium]